MSVDYFEVVMTPDGLQSIPVTETLKRGPVQDESKRREPEGPPVSDMTMIKDNLAEAASGSDPHPVPMRLLAPDEPRAPIAILSPAKRAALLACWNGGSLHKRHGVWTSPSAITNDKPISGVTVADLRRDGMLTVTVLGRSASVRLTTRGIWFARTVAAEIAEAPL